MDSKRQRPAVLFNCTDNSVRSQIAEAFLKHHAGDRFEVLSAGPAATPDEDEEEQLEKFRQVRDRIERRIQDWLGEPSLDPSTE